MLDPATLATPPIKASDVDRAQRLVAALGALGDLVDAAGDLHGVRPDRLACLIASLTDPLEQELEALATRVEAAAAPPPVVVTIGDAEARAALARAIIDGKAVLVAGGDGMTYAFEPRA